MRRNYELVYYVAQNVGNIGTDVSKTTKGERFSDFLLFSKGGWLIAIDLYFLLNISLPLLTYQLDP